MPEKIVLNFFPVKFSSEEITIYTEEYSDAKFNTLTKTLKGCCIWRDGNTIYIWKHGRNVPTSLDNFKAAKINLKDHPQLFSRILAEGIYRRMEELGYVKLPGRYGNFEFADFSLSSNLLAKGHRFKIDARVGIFPRIILETFFSSFSADIILGLIVDLSTVNKLDISLDELSSLRMDCRNLYVKLKLDNPSSHPFGHLNNLAIGSVIEIANGRASLTDLRDYRLKSIEGGLCFPIANWMTIDKYLSTVHEKAFPQIKEAYQKEVASFNWLKKRYELIEGVIAKLTDNGKNPNIEIADGLNATIKPNYPLPEDKDEFKLLRLNKPVFCFDFSSLKTSGVPDEGIKLYGPYSQEVFHPGKIFKILVISPDIYKGTVEEFLKKFENGIKEPKNVYSGFLNKYKIAGVQFKDIYFKLTTKNPEEDYRNICIQCLSDFSDYDLAFVMIREEFKKLFTTSNPYFIGKAILLSHKIPVQDLTIEKIREGDYGLKYICNNIALACYAKLGGTPWVLRARELLRHELIIGIGSSIIKESKLSKGEKIIGFTTIFKCNGDYLINDCTPYSSFDNYEKNLENTVVSSIESVAKRENYKDGEEIRIIFHVFKRTGKKEVNAIQKAIKRLNRFKIEFSLVHVNNDHHFKMFDKFNQKSGTERERMSQYIPARMLMVNLGPRDRLINLTGPFQYRGKGCPTPIRVTLDRSSTFKDVDYVCQQIYEFSFMSWRSFFPSTEPVTLMYSNLIGSLTGKLQKIPEWSQSIILTSLRDRLWFI